MRFDVPGATTFYVFAHRNGDLGNDCLDGGGQTVLCHSVGGAFHDESTQVGTYTAAFGAGDGIPHSWTRRATYWIKNVNVGGSP